MSPTVALALSFGVLGGAVAAVFPHVGLPTWGAFIGWGCYLTLGATADALKRGIAGMVFGAICAWGALVITSMIHTTGNMWMVRAFLVVGISAAFVVLASASLLSATSAAILGYAATLAFLLQTPGALRRDNLLDLGPVNGLVSVSVSMVIGAVLGALAQQMPGARRTPSA